ncbi:MAG: hypothetical protein U0X71_04725 [Sphingobacteriaceae bacterium]
MIEATYIHYFEQLATQHRKLQHGSGGKNKSFFVIQNTYDLTEFDNAIRNNPCERVLLLDMPTGYLTDNGSANYTQFSKIDFMIVGKATSETISAVRQDCFQIGMDFITKIRTDQQKQAIIPNRNVYLQENNIQYDLVGPIQQSHHGYSFSFQFCCPFAWQEKEEPCWI